MLTLICVRRLGLVQVGRQDIVHMHNVLKSAAYTLSSERSVSRHDG